MNSVMNIGDNIIFIKEGIMEWQGSKYDVITSNNQALNDFIFASDLFRKVKDVEASQEEDIKQMKKKSDNPNFISQIIALLYNLLR
jgi:ABC-type transporter Mla maintaining outer membrane lipid asymmetry ATPase subunit MlaF